ncbi:DNA-binding response regulator, OmpR family, contains REC and winged-helix (wHTH) domain [Raineyella antarctica]|uniref:DNA-binding response regulator, OmpR family, contains REC and winged-helix (WHTH) domain n=2 Tax=Raineyella antarctica TaxID=1577474 RepID=A0A1G6GGF1_9ACTN|nr:DNA-binding response regulator, OmpR family, contains REC and winged-helix (wHTH) domain [Raineyella antarctica]
MPSLGLLSHQVALVPLDAAALLHVTLPDVILIDATSALSQARALTRVIGTSGKHAPILLVTGEGGLPALSTDWGFVDFVLAQAGPAELEARLRLVTSPVGRDEVITTGSVTIDEAGYAASVNGQPLDLTYTEFELLKYLLQHPGRVFSREQLLSDVWGYDYFGGSRTVDVHVRRLRAKLGPEHEGIIGTVRNVGYRLVPEANG